MSNEGSLRARKQKTLDEALPTDYESIVIKQLELLEKQSENINKLVEALTEAKQQTIVIERDSVTSNSQIVNDKIVRDNDDFYNSKVDDLIIEDLIKTDGISSKGDLQQNQITGESIEEKIKKLKELKGE